ncbi:beta-galactosidase [Candidatus Uhrbacteria bacterium]|nr:beta-galactosidase [Candidatus Uhrbacteria bacterium]
MATKRRYWLSFVLFGIFFLGVFVLYWLYHNRLDHPQLEPTRYGITFSTEYAGQLGLDAAQTYRSLIEDLGVRSVRLPVYWSSIEREKGSYDFALLDQLVAYSQAMNVKLTLVVGTKVPRWPECYVPDWAEVLGVNEQQRAAIDMITTVVTRYKDSSAVERWQVENEPFFPFGTCPTMTVAQFRERVEAVRKLDPARPIQVTVSGEIGPWSTETDEADILGVSMYRLTWNDLFGYFMYPLSPEYYYVRAQLAQQRVSKVIISELQAEPWFPEPREKRTLAQWYQSFDAQMFDNNLQFVKDTHLPEVYLWGAEWWALLKTHGDDRLWNVAKEVFGGA